MAQELELKISGLKTNPSPQAAKPGGLEIANNINISSPNTATSRRGFKKYGTQVTLGANKKIKKMTTFKDKLLIHYDDDTLAYDSDGAGAWTSYSGTYTEPSTEKGMAFTKADGALYFTTTAGIKRLDTVDLATVIPEAGVPKGLMATATLNLTGTGFFEGGAATSGNQIAYKIVWGYNDVNNKVVIGAPSERIELINTSDSGSVNSDVDLVIYIPDGITASYFYQVYRSGLSGNETTIANEELQLVYEDNPSAAEISAGSISITDSTVDSLRGATIYTAPSQEGILASNEQPPYAEDMAQYKNTVLYAKCRARHTKTVTLIAAGGTAGLSAGDVVTINSEAYACEASEDLVNGQFKEYTAGTPSENIANTAKSLIRAINLKTSNVSTYAYYASGYDELPGKIVIRRRDVADTSFAITLTTGNSGEDHSGSFNPTLPTSGTTVSSSADDGPNRVYVSKPNEPDAVPLTNFFNVGTDQSEIVRILPLRDSVMILKDDGEIYRLTGEDIASFVVRKFDDTVTIYGARTAVVFNNQVFCFSDQGVVAISDSGVGVKSWDVEDDVIQFLSTSVNPDFKNDAFGVAYETERQYILSDSTQCYVYSAFTNSWTRWTVQEDFGLVNPVDDKLYWGNSNGYVYQERKDYTKFDYADEELSVTVSAATSAVAAVALTDVTGVSVGQSIKQGNNSAYISAIDVPTKTLTLDKPVSFLATAATINDAITCEMRWLPIYGGSPGTMAKFYEMTIMFRDMNDQFTVEFLNNFQSVTAVSVDVAVSFSGDSFGDGLFGDGLFGGTTSGSVERRTYFPLSMQRALWAKVKFKTERAFTSFTLNALAVTFDQGENRFNRGTDG